MITITNEEYDVLRRIAERGLEQAQNQNANKAEITKAVQALIKSLYSAFVTDDSFINYQCQCSDGTHSYSCCQLPASCTPSAPCTCPDSQPASYACCTGCDITSLLPSVLQVHQILFPLISTISIISYSFFLLFSFSCEIHMASNKHKPTIKCFLTTYSNTSTGSFHYNIWSYSNFWIA